MKSSMRCLMISGLVALLAACGGGGDGDDSSGGAQLPSGIFAGSWTGSDNSSGRFSALIAENESEVLADDGTRMHFKFSVSGTAVSGKGSYYYEDDTTTTSGTLTTTGSVSGTKLTLKITRSDGVVNNAVFQRIPESDTAASFDKLKGSYKTDDQSADITFTDIGSFSGRDNDGCVYSGDVDIPDATVNVYQVHLNVASCKYAGAYTGLAAIEDADNSVAILFGNASRLALQVFER